ncbi:MAG: DUF6111 family protein [Sphingomonadales bacterium]
MSRILFNMLLLALPFVVYGGWVAFLRKKEAETGGTWDDAPTTWLLIIGLSLMIISLFAMRLVEDNVATGEYIPPHLEDGKIVPAEIRPRKDGD